MGSRSLGRPVNGMQYGRHNGPFPSSFAIFSSPLFPVHLSLVFFASLSTFSCTSCILFASTFSSVFFFFSPSKELSPIANQFSVATESGASASMTSSSLPSALPFYRRFSRSVHTRAVRVSATRAHAFRIHLLRCHRHVAFTLPALYPAS